MPRRLTLADQSTFPRWESFLPFCKSAFLALRLLMGVDFGSGHVAAGVTSGHMGAPSDHPYKDAHLSPPQAPEPPWIRSTEDPPFPPPPQSVP